MEPRDQQEAGNAAEGLQPVWSDAAPQDTPKSPPCLSFPSLPSPGCRSSSSYRGFVGRRIHPSTEPCSQLQQVRRFWGSTKGNPAASAEFAQLHWLQIPVQCEHGSPRREKIHSHGKPGAKWRGEESRLSSPHGCRGVGVSNSHTLLNPQPLSCPNLDWPKSALVQSQT